MDAAPPPAADRTPLAGYLTEAATLISARTKELAESAIRDRPPAHTVASGASTAS